MTMQKIIKTKILNQDIKSIKKAIKLLKQSELVSFPTETVYGLGASAFSNKGIAKLFAVKGRPKYNPLIIHVSNPEDAYNWAKVPKAAEVLIENFWPGPLTLVLEKNENSRALASLATGQLKTIAIRVPMHSVARSLIKEFGAPIAAPSANISGKISPTRAKDVLFHMDGKISALIKGDNCSVGLESTIINFSKNGPVLLRPGGTPIEIIEKKLGKKLLRPDLTLAKKSKIQAPGMLDSHYAPNSNLKLNVENPTTNELFLGFGDMPKNALGLNLSQGRNLEEAAMNFFATLTDIDEMAKLMEIKTISVAPIPNYSFGIAINDRLKRAAVSKS